MKPQNDAPPSVYLPLLGGLGAAGMAALSRAQPLHSAWLALAVVCAVGAALQLLLVAIPPGSGWPPNN